MDPYGGFQKVMGPAPVLIISMDAMQTQRPSSQGDGNVSRRSRKSWSGLLRHGWDAQGLLRFWFWFLTP